MDRSRSSSSDSSTQRESDFSESTIDKQDERSMVGDEEKVIGLDGIEHTASMEEAIMSSKRAQSGGRQSNSLKRVESHHSRAGADGYTWHHDGDESSQRPNRAKAGVVTPQPYLVAFDGDADPENPRSMSTPRRWAIVLICAVSSLCV